MLIHLSHQQMNVEKIGYNTITINTYSESCKTFSWIIECLPNKCALWTRGKARKGKVKFSFNHIQQRGNGAVSRHQRPELIGKTCAQKVHPLVYSERKKVKFPG